MNNLMARATPYLQATPLALILGFFLLVPILLLVIVSFWDYDFAGMYPGFFTFNYAEALGSWVTWRTYLNTLKFALLVWGITAFLGFWVAYFLAFHIRTTAMQMVLFLVCTVPFLTSNIIRMISWIPVLGRNGLVNSTWSGPASSSSRSSGCSIPISPWCSPWCISTRSSWSPRSSTP